MNMTQNITISSDTIIQVLPYVAALAGGVLTTPLLLAGLTTPLIVGPPVVCAALVIPVVLGIGACSILAGPPIALCGLLAVLVFLH